MNMLRHALAAAVVAGGLGLGFVSAQAGPIPGPSAVAPLVVESGRLGLEQVHYRHRGWHHRHRGPQLYFGFGNRWGGHGRHHHNRHRGW